MKLSKSEISLREHRAWLVLCRAMVGTHIDWTQYLGAAKECKRNHLKYKEIEEAETKPHFYWKVAS